jgi:hypothetical protein
MKLGKKAVGVALVIFIATAGMVTLVSAGPNGGVPLWDRLWQVWIAGGNITITDPVTLESGTEVGLTDDTLAELASETWTIDGEVTLDPGAEISIEPGAEVTAKLAADTFLMFSDVDLENPGDYVEDTVDVDGYEHVHILFTRAGLGDAIMVVEYVYPFVDPDNMLGEQYSYVAWASGDEGILTLEVKSPLLRIRVTNAGSSDSVYSVDVIVYAQS